MSRSNKTHIVLVHGACHGAWCWYKVKPMLEAAGHRVTALDMAASGINMKSISQVVTARDYSEPLLEFMEALPDGEKVLLVGHSLGGINLAIAMELFPLKISLAVFLTAFLPDTLTNPSYVIKQFISTSPNELWMDTQFSPYGPPNQSGTTMLFGPDFLAYKLYQLSPIEDLELINALIRPSSMFVEDLSKAEKFSDDKYGSVKRVYIVCKEDYAITQEFQKWMIKNCGGCTEVVEIDTADHMVMFSKPQELSHCLTVLAKSHC